MTVGEKYKTRLCCDKAGGVHAAGRGIGFISVIGVAGYIGDTGVIRRRGAGLDQRFNAAIIGAA